MKDEVFERRTFLWGYMHSVSMFAHQSHDLLFLAGIVGFFVTFLLGVLLIYVPQVAIAILFGCAVYFTVFSFVFSGAMFLFSLISVKLLYGFWPSFSRNDVFEVLESDSWQTVNEICRAMLRSKASTSLVGKAAIVLLPDHVRIERILDHLAIQGRIERQIDARGAQYKLLRRGGLMM
jgi:hypothetical protein